MIEIPRDWREGAGCVELPIAEVDRVFFTAAGAAERAHMCGTCPVRHECQITNAALREFDRSRHAPC